MEPARWPASAWLLLLVNLIPVFGVVMLDWQVLTVLVLFWLENVSVGLVNLLRMSLTRSPAQQKLSMMAFFTVHYGGFALGHGFAVTHFFGDSSRLDLEPSQLWQFIQQQGLMLALLAMAISHLVSFLLNDARSQGLRDMAVGQVMRSAYQRVVLLHVTILIGGFLVQMLGSPIWALLVLVAGKISMDLKAHLTRLAADQPQLASH